MTTKSEVTKSEVTEQKVQRTEMTFTEIEQRMDKIEPLELGQVLKEYLGEMNYSGSEGFSSRDLTGIRRFLADLILYCENN